MTWLIALDLLRAFVTGYIFAEALWYQSQLPRLTLTVEVRTE